MQWLHEEEDVSFAITTDLSLKVLRHEVGLYLEWDTSPYTYSYLGAV